MFSTFCESHATDIAFRVVARLLRAAAGVSGLDGKTHGSACANVFPTPTSRICCWLMTCWASPTPSCSAADRSGCPSAAVDGAGECRVVGPHRPALYVIEDAHWIDEVSESMLADFFTVIPQTPSMVVITYRPEYDGALTQIHGAHTIALAPLSDPESSALVAKVLGPDPSVGRVATDLARAAGNPFFAQEMVRDLAERGVLQGTAAAMSARPMWRG